MAQIQPISTWFQGSQHQANVFSLYGQSDNLKDSASFLYQLIELIIITPEDQNSQTLINGIITISGADYEQWNTETDANAWIYDWAATQLNLVLIP